MFHFVFIHLLKALIWRSICKRNRHSTAIAKGFPLRRDCMCKCTCMSGCGHTWVLSWKFVGGGRMFLYYWFCLLLLFYCCCCRRWCKLCLQRQRKKKKQVIWTFVLEPTRHEHLVLGFESRCEGGGDAPRWGRIRAVEVCGETARSCKCTALAAYKRELALWFQKDWHIVFIHSRGSWGKRSGWVRSSGFATTSDIPERVPDCGPAAKDNGYSNCERRLIQEQSEYFCELCVLWNIIRLLKS